ncbi:hypothetical protein [Flavobacterium psychrotrophum]|uniref:hypothetical protein n=1 Tax=Flavobacterium psychrotrophum TaxID=2294119 RepID=UPI000E324584|nr:hypothetical protein [Flavobacterium psychrotrophum]
MDIFEQTDRDTWNTRREWVDKELQDAEIGCHLLSDHATALFMDMQLAYCAGAWISVVVMSVSVIDAHLRETEAMDNCIGTAKLLDEYYEGKNINWLRQLRNHYVHLNMNKNILKMNDWFDNQLEFEMNATKAIKMTISALFQNPGI